MRRLVLEEDENGIVHTRIVYEEGDREFISMLDVWSMLMRARGDLPSNINRLVVGRFPNQSPPPTKKPKEGP